MRLEEVTKTDIIGKNVLIIGCPASGKTYLSNKMATPSHRIVHTDDYNYLGYEMGMYAALDVVNMSELPTITEGIHGYRMLRKGVEQGSYFPDIVIEIEVSSERMYETYQRERDESKLKHLIFFDKTYEAILSEYRSLLPTNKKPEWIKVLNDY